MPNELYKAFQYANTSAARRKGQCLREFTDLAKIPRRRKFSANCNFYYNRRWPSNARLSERRYCLSACCLKTFPKEFSSLACQALYILLSIAFLRPWDNLAILFQYSNR